MANANDVAVNAQYRGDSNLGGANFGIISIDTQPLQNLAAYTYAYNKTKWEQTQKDAEVKAKELAQVTAYNLSTAIPKDSKEIRQKYNEFYSWVQKNPTVLDYKNNESGWLEYNKRKNDFANDLVDAKSRNITYMAGLAAIEKETNPKLKAILQKRLDDQGQNTDLRTPIRIQDYDVTIPTVPIPPVRKFDVQRVDEQGNFITDRTVGVVDMKSLKSSSNAIAMGLTSDLLDQNSAEFKSMTPEAQRLKIEEFETKQATGRLLPVETANTFNEAIKSAEFLDENGNVDFGKIKATNPLLQGNIEAMDKYNDYVNTMRAQIKSGVFKDQMNNSIQFGMENLDESDYQPIDYSKGISANQLLDVEAVAKALPDTYATKVTETDLGIKKAKLAQDWAEIEFKKKQAAKVAEKDAPEIIQDPATLFGEHSTRIATFYQKNPNAQVLNVPYASVDKETRIATGLQENQNIEFSRDGSWVVKASTSYSVRDDKGNKLFESDGKTPIKTYNKGEVIKRGTIDGIKKGYIDAVKIGQGTDGSQTEEFQRKSEEGFSSMYGSNSAGDIYNSFMSKTRSKSSTSTTQSKGATGSRTMKGKDGKVYSSTDGITWTAPDGTTVRLKTK